MEKEISKEVIAALLILTIVISVMGSYSLLAYKPVTTQEDMPITTGKVKLFVMNKAEPYDEKATINLNVIR
ncbi:MAG: hypothetical protein J7K26_01170 [Candidatus Aenigmarchaeota archaeon]|nr:hypothetical protein [Candidatus Aenigmarchaeota archaeon]